MRNGRQSRNMAGFWSRSTVAIEPLVAPYSGLSLIVKPLGGVLLPRSRDQWPYCRLLREKWAIEKSNSFDSKLCRISAALRHVLNSDSDFLGFVVVRNEHHRRDASLFSIAVQFPKLASGAQRTRSRKVMKISRAFATLAMTGSGEIERPVEKSRPTSWLVRRMRR